MYEEYPRSITKLPKYGPLPPLPPREQGKLKTRGSTTDVRAWAMQPEIHSEYIHEWIMRPTETRNSFPLTNFCKLMFLNDPEDIESEYILPQTTMQIGEMTNEEIKIEISRVMPESEEEERMSIRSDFKDSAKEYSQNRFIPIEKEIHDNISHEIYENNAEEIDQEEVLSIKGNVEDFVKEFSQNRFMPIENEIRSKISREIYEENAEEIDQTNETILPTDEALIQRESSSTDLTRVHNSEIEISADIRSEIYKQIDEMLNEALRTVLTQIHDETVINVFPQLGELNISEIKNLIAEDKQAIKMLEQESLISEQLLSIRSENDILAAIKSEEKVEKSWEVVEHETGKVDDLLVEETTTTEEKDENSKIEQINKAGPSKLEIIEHETGKDDHLLVEETTTTEELDENSEIEQINTTRPSKNISVKRKCPCLQYKKKRVEPDKENRHKSPVSKICHCIRFKKKEEKPIREKESYGKIRENKNKLVKVENAIAPNEEKDQILLEERNEPLNERDKPFSEEIDDLPSGEIDQLVKEEREETLIEESENKPFLEETDKLLQEKSCVELSSEKFEPGVDEVDNINKVQATENEFIDSEIVKLAEDSNQNYDINNAELTDEEKNDKCVEESINTDITQMENEINDGKGVQIQHELSKLSALEIKEVISKENEVFGKLTEEEDFDLEQLSTQREISGLGEITKSEEKVNSAVNLLTNDNETKEGISTDSLVSSSDLKSDLNSQATITIDTKKRKLSHTYSSKEVDIRRQSVVVGSTPLYEISTPELESEAEENILVDDNKDDELDAEQGMDANHELRTEISKPSTAVVNNAWDSDKGSRVYLQPTLTIHCINEKCQNPKKCKSQRLLNSDVTTTTRDAKSGSDFIECMPQRPSNLLVKDTISGSDQNENADNLAWTPKCSRPNVTAQTNTFTKEVSEKINDILNMIDEFKIKYASLESLNVNCVEENNNEDVVRALETIHRVIEILQRNALASASNRSSIEALEEIKRLKDICVNLQNNLKAAAREYGNLKQKLDENELAHEESKELCKLRNELNIVKTQRNRLQDYSKFMSEMNTDCHLLTQMIKKMHLEYMILTNRLKLINDSVENYSNQYRSLS